MGMLGERFCCTNAEPSTTQYPISCEVSDADAVLHKHYVKRIMLEANAGLIYLKQGVSRPAGTIQCHLAKRLAS
jgi:hypothetical protein